MQQKRTGSARSHREPKVVLDEVKNIRVYNLPSGELALAIQDIQELAERAASVRPQTSDLEDSLQNDNPAILAKYREANSLTLQAVVNRLQEVLTTGLVAYIAGASARSVRNWASGSIQSARLDSMMKLRAALTAMLILQEAEAPETIANWFINVNSYLDDISPSTAMRDGNLRATIKAARVYAAYA